MAGGLGWGGPLLLFGEANNTGVTNGGYGIGIMHNYAFYWVNILDCEYLCVSLRRLIY